MHIKYQVRSQVFFLQYSLFSLKAMLYQLIQVILLRMIPHTYHLYLHQNQQLAPIRQPRTFTTIHENIEVIFSPNWKDNRIFINIPNFASKRQVHFKKIPVKLSDIIFPY